VGCLQRETPEPLAAIVASRPPWLRARLSTLLVWPTLYGNWTAILSYAHYTTVQPGETPPPDNHVTCPHDTHHPVAVDGGDAAAVQAQAQDRERTGAVGRLTLNGVTAPPWTPSGPPSPGWTILTHSGSEAERRAWPRRVGQAEWEHARVTRPGRGRPCDGATQRPRGPTAAEGDAEPPR